MPRLVLVPTPIGNLADITLRALETLKNASLILAEDTRTSSFLLRHYQIGTPMIAYHKFNEHAALERLVRTIVSSEMVALISDAGTPGISDPGFLLVRRCVAEGIDVEVLPGASALLPALVSSGFPCDRFCFEGFLPHKKGRNKRLELLQHEKRTIILYESPYRLVKTLTQLAEILGGERPVSVSRELTKKFEQTVRDTLSGAAAHFTRQTPKGEFVIVVAGEDYRPDHPNEETHENEIENGE